MATIVWTEEAERRLRKIHDYIARDKPAAAFNVVESICRRFAFPPPVDTALAQCFV